MSAPQRSYITTTTARCCGVWSLEVTVALDDTDLIRLYTQPGAARCPSCGCEATIDDPTRFDPRDLLTGA